jgi:hypothetical protein
VQEQAARVGVPLKGNELVFKDVHDLQALATRLQRIGTGPSRRRLGWLRWAGAICEGRTQ